MFRSVKELLYAYVLLIVPLVLLPSKMHSQCAPEAKCKTFLNFSLDNNGVALVPASILDNGSVDCNVPPGALWFKVKRMTAPNGYDCFNPGNPNYKFDDYVQLCCEDVGDTINVIFRVYNVDPGSGPVDDTVGTGHFNDCMSGLEAVDKLPPVIVCPPDTTIECGAMFSDYSLYGDPVVTDNCDSVVVDVVVDTQLNICNVGTILRKFIATDIGGLKDSCIQTITVVNNHPFDGNDPNQLIWPKDTAIYGCYDNIDTAISGRPTIIEDECDLVGVDYQDQTYYFGKRSACYKIIRIWKVVDWCQYDPKLGCRTDNGCWTHEQIVKVLDTIPPIVTGVKDTTIFNFTSDCSSLFVNLDTAIAYDCDSTFIKHFEIDVDLYSDGTIDSVKIGNDASGYYPNGVHRITFKAFDKCGNIGDSTIVLTVKDKKKPSPIGNAGIVVALNQMQNGVMAMVFARQLDNGSYDNCTLQSELKFSFSSDVNDSVRIYNCDSIINSSVKNVELWVTDECGNQDYVKTFVFVQDNAGLCPGNLKNNIFGLVMDAYGKGSPFIKLVAKDGKKEYDALSKPNGAYELQNIKDAKKITVYPIKTDDVLKGVNTKDLVAIKKYLLGKIDFDSPWQYIAADVDMSNNISTRDILLLRNLILRRSQTLPHGLSWRFVLADHRFGDPRNPFVSGMESSYTINNFDSGMRIDFKGTKLGDVVQPVKLKSSGTREVHVIKGRITSSGEGMPYGLSINDEVDLAGLYCEILLPEGVNRVVLDGTNLRGFSHSNYYLDPATHILRVVWSDPEGIYIFKDQNLLFLRLYDGTKEISLSKVDWRHSKGEIIQNDLEESVAMDFIYMDSEIIKGDTKEQLLDVEVHPNPFHNEVEIAYFLMRGSEVSVLITDQFGRQMYSSAGLEDLGEHTFRIAQSKDWRAGVYFCTIRTDEQTRTIKLVKTE